MRTKKPAAMIDSGSAIQAEISKHAYIAAHVAKNPPNDVVSCAKLRDKMGGWRMSGSVCVAIALRAMLRVRRPVGQRETLTAGATHGHPVCFPASMSSKLGTARATAVIPSG